MNIKFHPYKGYLNTKFALYCNGEKSEDIVIYREKDSAVVKKIKAQPYKSYFINLDEPGTYKICHGEDVVQYFSVEDGFKFGGSIKKMPLFLRKLHGHLLL